MANNEKKEEVKDTLNAVKAMKEAKKFDMKSKVLTKEKRVKLEKRLESNKKSILRNIERTVKKVARIIKVLQKLGKDSSKIEYEYKNTVPILQNMANLVGKI